MRDKRLTTFALYHPYTGHQTTRMGHNDLDSSFQECHMDQNPLSLGISVMPILFLTPTIVSKQETYQILKTSQDRDTKPVELSKYKNYLQN